MISISRSSLSEAANWVFGQVERRSFQAETVYDQEQVNYWQPAVVPGNVRADLERLGQIPDLYFDQNYLASSWVDEADWWYRTTLQADLAPNQRSFVRFHGLDYLAAVFANDTELTRHVGMFSPVTVELTDQFSSGICHLGVRLWGSEALPRRQLSFSQKLRDRIGRRLQGGWVGVYPDRTATLKTQMSFGWDFAPPIRTVGIWDEVDLIVTGPIFIEDCQVAVTPTGQGTVQLCLNSRQPLQAADVALTVTPFNFDGASHTFRFLAARVQPDRDGFHYRTTVTFKLPDPQCWQPWDRGYPHLYNLQAKIGSSDELTVRFGIRSVQWENWQLKINDQRTFVRGLNWVPADCLPGRVTTADYTDLLNRAKATGANLLRVWGGGLREKKGFYDQCDELGLMVWQEFPFACVFIGTFPDDPAYLALVRQEANAIVKQLNHHPALVLWCGGNEFSPSRNRPLIETLAQAVRTQGPPDPAVSAPFHPVSPSQDEVHNWEVWHGLRPIADYQHERARFLSEFGLQALPDRATLAASLPDPNQDWAKRQGDVTKLERYARSFLENGLEETALSTLIEASQRAQAVGLQTAIEHVRRRKAHTGGTVLWQFNEPWPAISWAILDYFRRPKLAYHRLKWWYNPVLICLEFKPGRDWQPGQSLEAMIWGINDTLEPVRGSLQIELDGQLIFENPSITLPPDDSIQIGELIQSLNHKPVEIRLLFQDGQREISRNLYDLNWRETETDIPSKRLRRWAADITLK